MQPPSTVVRTYISLLTQKKALQIKNYTSLGTILNKEQSQNVNGGISVSCSSSDEVNNCTVIRSNGHIIRFNTANGGHVSASNINGKETVTYGGKTSSC